MRIILKEKTFKKYILLLNPFKDKSEKLHDVIKLKYQRHKKKSQ